MSEPEAPAPVVEALPTESEAVRLVKSMRTKDQTKVGSLSLTRADAKTLNEMHDFINGDAQREQEMHEAIAAHLAPTTQLFVRRMLESRKAKSCEGISLSSF